MGWPLGPPEERHRSARDVTGAESHHQVALGGELEGSLDGGVDRGHRLGATVSVIAHRPHQTVGVGALDGLLPRRVDGAGEHEVRVVETAAELLGQPDVDGGLIGGASLKVEDFTAIVKAGL